jgi:hypothetical protein
VFDQKLKVKLPAHTQTKFINDHSVGLTEGKVKNCCKLLIQVKFMSYAIGEKLNR